MNLLAPVSTIMTVNPISVSPVDPLFTVNEIFKENKLHHIPVVDKGHLVGMVSNSDFLFFKRGFHESALVDKMEEIRLHNYTVNDIMTTGLAKLSPNDKINVALEVFKRNILHAIPVVEGDRLVGILTTHDIISNLADDKSAVNEYPESK